MTDKKLLIIEDGDEYLRFFSRYLSDFEYYQARSLADCAALFDEGISPDGLVLDLRFDRVPREDLIGDVEQMADGMFGGDPEAALRYIIDNQGYLILQQLRARGHHQPALLVADLPTRRQENLRKLYGRIGVVPSFDRRQIAKALGNLLR